MPDPPDGLLDVMARRDAAVPPGTAVHLGRRGLAAVIALAIAGGTAPIAVAAIAASSGLLGAPLAASTLVALLVLAPIGVALAAALNGLRQVAAALVATAEAEAEQAVLRVLVATATFGYALALVVLTGSPDAAPLCVAVAAGALIAAWLVLLDVTLRPAAPSWRHSVAIALDMALLSAFLHVGGGATAGWYGLYLIAIFYVGWRFGPGALVAAASAGVVGFAAVALSTPFWRDQPALSAGLLAALAALSLMAAATIRQRAAADGTAAAAESERRSLLLLIADALRDVPPTSDIDDILDLAALETGGFAAPIESFDLYDVIASTLVPLAAEAEAAGFALRWRVDPSLPARLRGHARAFARILRALAAYAVDTAETSPATLRLDGVADGNRLTLRLRLAVGDPSAGGAFGERHALALRLTGRLVTLMGGTLACESATGGLPSWTAAVPLTIEADDAGPALDLTGQAVLVATEDGGLADELAGLLTTWNAEVRWADDGEAALAELSQREAGAPAVMIVDCRARVLPALGLAHRAARLAVPPFVFLLGEEARLASLGELDTGELAGLIPTPVSARLLARALLALPLLPARAAMARSDGSPPPAARPGTASAGERVTPIAAHPRYAPEPATAVDARVIEGLRGLDGGGGFLREVIDNFRIDAQRIVDDIGEAAAAADAAGFARGLAALRRAAGHLGGIQLCELAASLQALTASQIRQQGAIHLQRLGAEIDRLVGQLIENLPGEQATRL